ncbi:hypothetical protein RA280_46650, partial [Cupriavidus sp. CV2]|uniref:hypothetical protein n=1 Tax=Cupriavidus ulmosensis TaxID=3065913 RepID=UPI00296AF16C
HQFPQLRVMLLVYGQGPSHLPHDCISMFSLGRIGLSLFCLHPQKSRQKRRAGWGDTPSGFDEKSGRDPNSHRLNRLLKYL